MEPAGARDHIARRGAGASSTDRSLPRLAHGLFEFENGMSNCSTNPFLRPVTEGFISAPHPAARLSRYMLSTGGRPPQQFVWAHLGRRQKARTRPAPGKRPF